MKPLDKLTELLCESERVKEDIMGSRFSNFHLHHLMMYCEDKNIKLIIQANWVVKNIIYWETFETERYNIVCNLVVNKPLYKQSDEVLEKIFNFLKG